MSTPTAKAATPPPAAAAAPNNNILNDIKVSQRIAKMLRKTKGDGGLSEEEFKQQQDDAIKSVNDQWESLYGVGSGVAKGDTGTNELDTSGREAATTIILKVIHEICRTNNSAQLARFPMTHAYRGQRVGKRFLEWASGKSASRLLAETEHIKGKIIESEDYVLIQKLSLELSLEILGAANAREADPKPANAVTTKASNLIDAIHNALTDNLPTPDAYTLGSFVHESRFDQLDALADEMSPRISACTTKTGSLGRAIVLAWLHTHADEMLAEKLRAMAIIEIEKLAKMPAVERQKLTVAQAYMLACGETVSRNSTFKANANVIYYSIVYYVLTMPDEAALSIALQLVKARQVANEASTTKAKAK